MTDYQFKSILKLVLNVVENAKDKDDIARRIKELIGEKPESKSGEQ